MADKRPTRLTLFWRSGLETSKVYPMAEAFRVCEIADVTGKLKRFVLESEACS